MTTRTASATTPVAVTRRSDPPLKILSEIASEVVPVLYDIAAKTWPPGRESTHRRFGVVGPQQQVRKVLPPQYRVLLRRYDLATLRPNWRLEAGGLVDFFEWDDSGRIYGSYGYRYPLYSVSPVFDELGNWSGFGLNGRPSNRKDGALSAIDARLACDAYIRSTDAGDAVSALRTLMGRPRVEEERPGIAPALAYIEVLQRDNKRLYFLNRGVNQYVGPGWTPETLRQAFLPRWVRAVWIADPNAPSATPTPEGH